MIRISHHWLDFLLALSFLLGILFAGLYRRHVINRQARTIGDLRVANDRLKVHLNHVSSQLAKATGHPSMRHLHAVPSARKSS